jgi:hypothetical protein
MKGPAPLRLPHRVLHRHRNSHGHQNHLRQEHPSPGPTCLPRGCDQILMLVSGKGGSPHMLAGNALLYKMRAVTPNRKLVVSPGKLHLVKTGTTHAGSKLGLRTFVDHDAALTVVVVAALTNILGEIPCQLGGKTHAPLYKTLRIFYAGFHDFP